MRLKNLLVVIIIPSVLSLGLLSNAHAQNGDSKPLTDLPRQFSATAFADAGVMAGKSFGLDVYITAWTTDQQVKDFAAVLKEKGADGLVSMMEKTRRCRPTRSYWICGQRLPLRQLQTNPERWAAHRYGDEPSHVIWRALSLGALDGLPIRHRCARCSTRMAKVLASLRPYARSNSIRRISWKSRTTARNPSASQTYISKINKDKSPQSSGLQNISGTICISIWWS